MARPDNEERVHGVLELRQYKIAEGGRPDFIEHFDRELIETQEAAGIQLLGQFCDLDDESRFTWIRAFPTMAERLNALTGFYSSPVWAANRDQVNSVLLDNDNVLLLKPAAPNLAISVPSGPRPGSGSAAAGPGIVICTILYLWWHADDAFAEFFARDYEPLLRRAGLEVIGAYVPERAANDYPRLPVRENEKVFLWFARAKGAADHEASLARMRRDPQFAAVLKKLNHFAERQPQTLRLRPTARSLLR